MAATEPGAPEAKPRSFGDELDDSLLESEPDHEPPVCPACPAVQLPLLGGLRAFGPLMDLGGLPTADAVEEAADATPMKAGGAAESIASHPAVAAAADTVAVPQAAVTAAGRPSAETVAVPQSAETVAVPQSAEMVAVRQSAETVAVRPSAETVAVRPSAETVAVRQSAEAVAVRPSAEAVAVRPSAETVAVRPSAETVAVRQSAETAAVRQSGADAARGVDDTSAVAKPAADAPEQYASREGAAIADPKTGAPSRGAAPPFGQERASNEGPSNGQAAPDPAPHSPSVSQPVERRPGPGVAQTGPDVAKAEDLRFVTGEGRPMPARASSTEAADSSDVIGSETLASKLPAVAVTSSGGRFDSDGGRRQGVPDQDPIPAAAVERSRVGGETAAVPDRVGAGREQPSAPPFFEPSAAAEPAPRAAGDTGPRIMPTGPPPTAAQMTPAPPTAEWVDVPRAPIAPETADSILQSMRLQYQRGGGDAVVHIKPEHLGPVSISLRVENGAVSAVIHAENGDVAEWLKANEQLLRDGLASSGLQLERFAVRRDGHPPDRRPWRPPEPLDRRRRGLQPESTFEITV